MDKFTLNAHLAALAAELVKKCGGYTAAALECDVKKSQLARAANPHHDYTLKASTIYHLEQACGEPIMTRGLMEMNTFKVTLEPVYPIFLGIDLADSATDLAVTIVAVMEDGKVTYNEYKQVNTKTTDIHAIAARINTACLEKIPHLEFVK